MRLRQTTIAADGRLSRGRFDALTILIHWTTVLAVLFLLASGWLFDALEGTPFHAPLLMVHRSVGVALWCLTALRFLWRQSLATFPPFRSDLPDIVRWAATGSEFGLYLLLALQPLTGLGRTLATGHPFVLFGTMLGPFTPRLPAVFNLFDSLHAAGGYGLAGLAGLHALAALFHHLVRRDDVLEAMLPWVKRKRRPA
jgi:superoxide oxidase